MSNNTVGTILEYFTKYDEEAIKYMPAFLAHVEVTSIQQAYYICYQNLNNSWCIETNDFKNKNFKFFFNKLS